MKSISMLYQGEESVTRLIDQGELHHDLPYFIQIITASESPAETLEVARFVQETFPSSSVMGFSASGLIYQGEQKTEGTLIMYRLLEKTQSFQACFSWEGKSDAEVAQEIVDTIADKHVPLMHVICGDYYDMHGFVDEFNKRNSYTAMVGGLVGDTQVNQPSSFLLTPEGIVEKGIVIIALCGTEYTFYNGVNTAHEPISGKHQLTKIEDGIWKEINGVEIRQWLYEQLSLEKLEAYSDWEVLCANDMLVHFPMVLEGSKNASRFLHYDQMRDGVVECYTKLPQGTEFRIGYVNPSECLKESFRLCNEVMNQPIEELFCYTCLFRRLYLQNCSEWELSPYKKEGLCGAFMMGEISYIDGRNEMLNGSCCLVGIAENESYIRPDIQVFEELTAIGDDTSNLLNIVLKRQQESTTRQNEELIQTLLRQQEEQEKQIYIDFNTGVPNYLKYKEDIKTNQLDKLCVVKIENSELLLTHLGHSAYLNIARKVLSLIQTLSKDLHENERDLLQFYVFNESTFFIAADERMRESHFMQICNDFYDNNHLIHLDDEEVVVMRFVMCLYQKDPVESALNALAASKNMQNSFFVYDDSSEVESSSEEFKLIGVLNRAFEGNGIIPYFQGIRNNKEEKISYYEALMRIQDVDGKIYVPGQFLDVAKKYHMYSTLSKEMISKVFDLFYELDEVVSINICAFDIQSEITTQMIYERLETCKKPQNFVFEILEDEAHQDFAIVNDFIAKVRALGAKVAIDDFGAGYSNLYEISNINFDIIKVDGSIIRNLPNNECNHKLLKVITYMGNLFSADIVAEFVENKEIQDNITDVGIGFSQGYLFAKPLPFEELGLG